MTVRTKLNIAVATMITVFAAAAAVTISAVQRSAAHTESYLRRRDQVQLTCDIRTDIHRHQLALHRGDDDGPWATFLIDDVDIQIRLAEDDVERQLWMQFRDDLAIMRATIGALPEAVVASADHTLVRLRLYYESTAHQLLSDVARAGLLSQGAIMFAAIMVVLLFLLYLLAVRRWLVEPVTILKRAADAIGEGDLDLAVPLSGNDELSDLGRRLEAMARRLEQHHRALLEARELSAIGELCSSVAHGLRNPLSAIRSSAQLATLRSGDDQSKASFEQIVNQVDRMEKRIAGLLHLSRPAELKRTALSFEQLAAAACVEAAPLIESRQINLDIVDNCPDQQWVGDRERLVTALSEILTNAAHHSAPGDTITLRGQVIQPNGGPPTLRLDVVDHGPGMTAATCAQAFKLFFTSRTEGTGVGLNLVKQIIEKHDGTIALNSTQGEGTTVTLMLPGDRTS